MQSTQIGYDAGRAQWFPDPLVLRNAGNTRYQIAEGIEQYAKYREEYAALETGASSIVQLSPGNFVGHHLIVNFSDISVFLNYSGLALEKSILGIDDAYRMSVILDLPRDLVGFGGNVNSSERMMIVPPGAPVLMQSPPGITSARLSIPRGVMERRLQSAPELADWFDKLGPHAIRIVSPWLTQRLRSDCLAVLETNFACQDEDQRWRLGQLLVANVVNALHMECLMSGGPTTAYGSTDTKRFLVVRNLLHEHLEDLESITSGSFLDMRQLGSRRTIEKAFSSSIKMGPLAYYRIVRLHDARRKLMDREAADQPIGDIAAELGFFDAGKFTAAYRKHFGELPSVTRKAALGREELRRPR